MKAGQRQSACSLETVSESRAVGETIGYQLRRLRRLRDITQEELADRANVSRDLVAKLEQGRRHTARLSSLASFARALDVELSALLERATEDDEAAGPVALRNARTVSGTIDRDMPELSLALGGCEPRDAVSVVERLLGEDVALSLAGIAQLVHEWLVVDAPQLAEPRAGRRIGTGLVDRVEDRAEALGPTAAFAGRRPDGMVSCVRRAGRRCARLPFGDRGLWSRHDWKNWVSRRFRPAGGCGRR
jgi:transcriptional regulator with XRE-family HTH domain